MLGQLVYNLHDLAHPVKLTSQNCPQQYLHIPSALSNTDPDVSGLWSNLSAWIARRTTSIKGSRQERLTIPSQKNSGRQRRLNLFLLQPRIKVRELNCSNQSLFSFFIASYLWCTVQGYLCIEMADKPEKNGHEAAPAEEKRKGKGGSKGGQKPEKPPAEKKSTGGRRKKGGDK